MSSAVLSAVGVAQQSPRPPRRSGPHRLGEWGMVTIEAAFGALFSALVALGLCHLIGVVVQVGELQAVAGEVARQHARGDIAAAHRVERTAPSGTRIRVSTNASDVVVDVALSSRPWGGVIPPAELTARAIVAREVST